MSRSASYVAGGTLYPMTFFKLSSGNDHTIVVCGAGDVAIGVVGRGTREAPIPGVTPTAAIAGESVSTHSEPENCVVLAGAAVTAGAYLKPDANGKAVTCSSGDKYSARARNGAAAAEAELQVTIEHGVAP